LFGGIQVLETKGTNIIWILPSHFSPTPAVNEEIMRSILTWIPRETGNERETRSKRRLIRESAYQLKPYVGRHDLILFVLFMFRLKGWDRKDDAK